LTRIKLVACAGVGKADAAGARSVGNGAHRPAFLERVVGQRKQRDELLGRQALDTKVHD
jgi:hypothetical protein